MVFVSYEIGCRECGQTDHLRRIDIKNDSLEADYLGRAEYEIMCVIENWRNSNSEKCEFCRSGNVEILEVKVNDVPLYNFEDLKSKHLSHSDYYIYMLNLEKSMQGIDVNVGGTPIYDDNFLKTSLETIKRLVENRPEEHFRHQPKGWFFVCVTGELNPATDKYEMEIQRLRVFGVSKNEIYTLLRKVAFAGGIDLAF